MRVRLAALASLATLAVAACDLVSPPDAPSGRATGTAAPNATAPVANSEISTGPAAPAASAADGAKGGGDDWRKVVSAADASNLARLDQAWRMARDEAEERGYASQVEALGPLVDPNAGQAGRLQPPPGAYRCRTIKLGSKGDVGLGYVDYPWFRCTVELMPGGDLVLTKVSGSQRTRGLLYPDSDRRLVFVGAQAWGLDEQGYPAYGQQPIRDQVGVLERIGNSRWRLAVPWPRVESKLEILELRR